MVIPALHLRKLNRVARIAPARPRGRIIDLVAGTWPDPSPLGVSPFFVPSQVGRGVPRAPRGPCRHSGIPIPVKSRPGSPSVRSWWKPAVRCCSTSPPFTWGAGGDPPRPGAHRDPGSCARVSPDPSASNRRAVTENLLNYVPAGYCGFCPVCQFHTPGHPQFPILTGVTMTVTFVAVLNGPL